MQDYKLVHEIENQIILAIKASQNDMTDGDYQGILTATAMKIIDMVKKS